MGVPNPFPSAKNQILEFTNFEDLSKKCRTLLGQPTAKLSLGQMDSSRRESFKALSMFPFQLKETLKVNLWLGTAANPQEIKDLDQKLGFPPTLLPDSFHKTGQPWEKAVIRNAKKGAAWDIPDARCLKDQDSGASTRKTSIPVKIRLSHESFVSRPPWDHRRNPGPAKQIERSHPKRLKQEGNPRLLRARPIPGRKRPELGCFVFLSHGGREESA
jgi:hypothetical protein